MSSSFGDVVLRSVLLAFALVSLCHGQATRFDALAKLPFVENRPTASTAQTLQAELIFQRATQTYLWAMPLLNTMGMRDGFDKSFGTGYNKMAIWEKRLDAQTKITTPNSDLIYGMVFVNLADTGPLVFEAPPKLQGILLDMWQRPIPYDDGKFSGDVGLPGPDGGAGGKFLILPPDYKGAVPTSGYYVCRSGTNNIFIFLRSFYQSLDNIAPAVEVLKKSVLYPLNGKDGAQKMQFYDASGKPHDMLPRTDETAFRQLKYLVDTEGSHLAAPDWLGMLAGLGIRKDKPFEPDAKTRKLLTDAAATAYKTSRVIGLQGTTGDADLRVYGDRQWVNPINNRNSRWPHSIVDLGFNSSEGYRDLDARIWFFTDYYSISPGMVSMTPGKGAFYMIAFNDSQGRPLTGKSSYKVKLPADIPAELFWSVTLYEAENASGLANGQPFPSLGKLNHPKQDADGGTTLYISPKAPQGEESNWLATVPGRGFFAILRLYAPAQAALDGTWKPGDIELVKP
jgi:hypothetical protein